MAKRQALLHGAACILCGALILPVSAADNLHFSGSLVASPCTLTMQGTGIAEVDFSSLDSSDFTPDGQSARKPLVFELTDCDSALSNGVQVTLLEPKRPECAVSWPSIATQALPGSGLVLKRYLAFPWA